jgi:DNA-binding GntR family transcriptional regulator
MSIDRLDTDHPLLWERVHETLERLIVTREIAPGAHLGEMILAEQLGVSRSPVREALRALHQDGWVELQARRGTFVRTPSRKGAVDLFEAREALEPDVVGLATDRADSNGVATLRQILRRGLRAVESGNEDELVELNSRFHAAVREIADNEVLDDLLNHLDKLTRWYFAPIALTRAQHSWPEHQELVDAIEDGDREKAKQLMLSHVQASKKAYMTATAHSETDGGASAAAAREATRDMHEVDAPQ